MNQKQKKPRNLEMNSIFLRRVPQLWSVSIDLPTKKSKFMDLHSFGFITKAELLHALPFF